MVQEISFKIGRRGAVLLLFSGLYAMLGVGYLLVPTDRVSEALTVATNLSGGTVKWWGFLWLIVAVLGFVTAFWPPGRDNWGFSYMAGMAYLWGAFYVLTYFVYGTDARGWISGLIFWAFGGALSLIAGWPEPRVIAKRGAER